MSWSTSRRGRSGARRCAAHGLITHTPTLALHATGTVHTSVGFSVPFVVTEFEPGRHWAWQVAGIPATHHRVEPVGDSSRVSMAVPSWAGAYLAVCSIALRRIDAMLTDSA